MRSSPERCTQAVPLNLLTHPQEALYEEDMGAKAAAAAAVAQLCREPGGLEALMEQPALLQVGLGAGVACAGCCSEYPASFARRNQQACAHNAHHHGIPFALQALARLLREDARKGDAGQLCVSLLAAFLALSHVRAAHPLLQQVGWSRSNSWARLA